MITPKGKCLVVDGLNVKKDRWKAGRITEFRVLRDRVQAVQLGSILRKSFFEATQNQFKMLRWTVKLPKALRCDTTRQSVDKIGSID